MITVAATDRLDRGILKQVQQLRLVDPNMAVVPLDAQANFSGLGINERLYVVAHGGPGTIRGSGLSNPIKIEDLITWLTDPNRGVPQGYNGGIVLLSCYSGQKPDIGLSVAGSVAAGLGGRAAHGMPVEGTTGYSYGTPEFGRSGRSSVVVHEYFYNHTNTVRMTEEWLKLTPTSQDGVLLGLLGVVDTGKTVSEQLELAAAQQKLSDKTPVGIAQELVTSFAKEEDSIQDQLYRILWDKIPGATAVDQAAFMLQNPQNQYVVNWNNAIDNQYKLHSDHYLWKLPADAFTTEFVQ